MLAGYIRVEHSVAVLQILVLEPEVFLDALAPTGFKIEIFIRPLLVFIVVCHGRFLMPLEPGVVFFMVPP